MTEMHRQPMLAILTTHPIQYQAPIWQALARRGEVPFEVWFLTRHGLVDSFDREFGSSFAWDLNLTAGYPHRFLGREPPSQLRGFFTTRLPNGLKSLVREHSVATLWLHGWQVLAYWQALAVARRYGCTVWMRGDSNDLAKRRGLRRILWRFGMRWLTRRVSRFLYIGTANRRLYEGLGVPTRRLAPAPYCVDNARYHEQQEELRPRRAELRAAWKIPKDAFCVLFAGKLIEKKRPLDLVHAARLFARDHASVPIHLLFVGTGKLLPATMAQCEVAHLASGLTDKPAARGAEQPLPRASFAGFLNQSEIARAYLAADCLVLPSDHQETWGLVVNEAMACGLPCIVSDACGCAEDLVRPIRENLCFPLGNADALAERLWQLTQDPVAAERLWRQVEPFGPDRTVDTVCELWQEASHCARGEQPSLSG